MKCFLPFFFVVFLLCESSCKLFQRTQSKDSSADSQHDIIHKPLEIFNEQPVYIIVEEMPRFKGDSIGQYSLFYKFINDNAVSPKDTSINGYVYIKCIIDTAGMVNRPRVLRGLNTSYDAEALRVVQLMEFVPGRQNGVAVQVEYSIPIGFGTARKK